MALYGFYDTAERDMFRRLIGVTRVGPKVALSVLSLLTPADVAAAVATQNAAAFARVPGMGKKTAERVLLELREKVAEARPPRRRARPPAGTSAPRRVAALVSLGYDGFRPRARIAADAQAESVEALITQRCARWQGCSGRGGSWKTGSSALHALRTSAGGITACGRTFSPNNRGRTRSRSICASTSRRPKTARAARPRAAVRPAGPWQDDPRRHHRQRNGRLAARHERPGHLACGRSCGAADQPRPGRRAVHRRDPPPQRERGGGALPGDGGFRARHHHRQGAVRAQHPARPAALHARGRDDAHGHAHLAAARPLRHQGAAGALRAAGAHADRAAQR